MRVSGVAAAARGGGGGIDLRQQRDTGLDTYGTPDWRVRLGLDWQAPVQGLRLGGRVNYTGSQWSDSRNQIELPSWHTFDLTASYATRFGNTPVRFNASVENVADRKYWIGTFSDGFVMPGAPRTFRVSTTMAF